VPPLSAAAPAGHAPAAGPSAEPGGPAVLPAQRSGPPKLWQALVRWWNGH